MALLSALGTIGVGLIGGAAAAGGQALAGAIAGGGGGSNEDKRRIAQQEHSSNLAGAGLVGIQDQLAPGIGSGMDAQMGLLQALQQQAAGGGPNPAQLMLQQATDQNVANQASLMAGQAGLNPALAARMVGQQGANIQQQAAGQGALMGAQQQLNAQGMLGNLAGSMIGQGQGAAGARANFDQNRLNQALGHSAQMASTQAAAQKPFGEAAAAGMGSALEGIGTGIVGGLFKKQGMAEGGVVEGQAPVPGDDEENDIVPVLLSPGEIVVPRSYANDPKAAAAFAHAVSLMSKERH